MENEDYKLLYDFNVKMSIKLVGTSTRASYGK